MAKSKKSTEENESTVSAPTSRRVISAATKPAHLVTSGRGRAREATEWDDVVHEWYKANEWQLIPTEGEEDMKDVFNAVKRATDHAGYGVDRHKDAEGNDEYPPGVWVYVRDPQHRGPKVGSKKDPRIGKMVAPDDEGYDELLAYLETDEGKEASRNSRSKETADA